MKKLIVIPLTCLALAAGCASSDKVRHAESTSETNQKLQRETDHRLRTLEQNVNTLDTQVAQLNNRVYEVRTRGGQKTGMTVVPIIPPQPYKGTAAAPAQPDAQLTANGPVAVPTAEFAAGQQAASQANNPAVNAAANPAAANPAAAQASARPSIAVASTSATSGTTSGKPSGNSGGALVIGSASNSASDPAATIRPLPAAPQREAAMPEAAPSAQTVGQTVAKPASTQATAAQPTLAEKPLTKAEARAIAKAEAKAAADAAKAEAAAAKAAAKAAPTPAVTAVATPASSPSATSSFALPPEAAKPAKPATAVQPMLPPVAAAGGNADVPVPAVPQSDLALPPEIPGLGLPPLPGEAKNAAPQNGAKAKAPAKAAPAPAPAAPALAATAPAPAAPAAAQPAALPKGGKGEEAAYKAALQPAMAGRPAESIGRFQTFLQEYPQGRFAANAEYWIGEGLYAQGKYGEALAQFQKVNSQWSSHHKNADALLKTGMTLSRMGDKEGAAQAYKKLLSQFPSSEAAGIARSRGLAR